VRMLVALTLMTLFAWVAIDMSGREPAHATLAAKCVGADPCLACVNCRECQHCRDGRTCGACKPKAGERALAYFAEQMCR
jgi:hypothetical protein